MPKTETKRTLTGSPGSQKRVKKAMTYKDGVSSSGVTDRPFVKKIGKTAQKVADTYADLRDKVIIKDKRDRAIYKEARDRDRDRKFESYEDYKKRMKKERVQKKADGGSIQKASTGIRSIIEEAMRKSVKNKTLTQKQMDKVVRNLDLIDAGKKPDNKKDGGMMKKNLKPVDKEKNPGLAKLPEEVRNKMGFMKQGGLAEATARLKAKGMKDGGMVLEIGLRPATKKENKMAKEMMGKKPKKMAGGGMVRGTGAAIRGKGFKGVF